MFDENYWARRGITDSARNILKQVPSRAGDRGLHVVDESSFVMLALWSLLLWERKVGRIAVERMGIDPFDLARGLDQLLIEKTNEHPVRYDQQNRRLVLAMTGEPYRYWVFEDLLEPLLQQAEQESAALGHDYVGSEHILLAIILLADSALTELLQQHSVDHGRAKEAILEVLGQ